MSDPKIVDITGVAIEMQGISKVYVNLGKLSEILSTVAPDIGKQIVDCFTSPAEVKRPEADLSYNEWLFDPECKFDPR